MSLARARVQLPARVAAGQAFEVRATLGHPMETGYRRGDDGRPLARDIVRRFEARLDGEPVFAAELHPAIAANPFIAFWLQVDRGGELELHWRGDNGFDHVERVRLTLA